METDVWRRESGTGRYLQNRKMLWPFNLLSPSSFQELSCTLADSQGRAEGNSASSQSYNRLGLCDACGRNCRQMCRQQRGEMKVEELGQAGLSRGRSGLCG